MILDAEKKGLIDKNTVIVEPTSGNQGIGLALIGAVRGYKTVIIMPDSVSEERRKLVKHYGAEVKLIHDAGDIGKCIQECIDTAFYMQHMDTYFLQTVLQSTPLQLLQGNLQASSSHPQRFFSWHNLPPYLIVKTNYCY